MLARHVLLVVAPYLYDTYISMNVSQTLYLAGADSASYPGIALGLSAGRYGGVQVGKKNQEFVDGFNTTESRERPHAASG